MARALVGYSTKLVPSRIAHVLVKTVMVARKPVIDQGHYNDRSPKAFTADTFPEVVASRLT